MPTRAHRVAASKTKFRPHNTVKSLVEKEYIERHNEGYWIEGTRVSLDSVALAFLDGLSPETIAAECFPVLTLEQVFGAITYYLAHRTEIDEYLKNASEEFESLREATRNADPEFHAKLIKARRESLMSEA